MSLLDSGNTLELLGYLVKSLLASLLGHAGIHIGPLEVLATCCSLQIAGSVLDGSALQQFKPHLGMFLLVGSSLLEDGSYLYVAVLLGL